MPNKYGLTVRVLATTGDVNLFEYGGGVVYAASQDHGRSKWISWEFWEPLDDPDDAKTLVKVYRVNVDDDLVEQLGEKMIADCSSYVGIPKADLLKAARSKDPRQRVFVLESVASYHGAINLDHMPNEMTVRDLQKRWSRPVHAFRKRIGEPGPSSVREAGEPGAKPKSPKEPASVSMPKAPAPSGDKVHLVRTAKGIQVRVAGRGKEDYPVLFAAGKVGWRHPGHWSAATKQRAFKMLLELKAKMAAHVKLTAPAAPKPKAPKRPKIKVAPKPKAAKKPKAKKAPKTKPAKPARKPKFHKGEHVSLITAQGVVGKITTVKWIDGQDNRPAGGLIPGRFVYSVALSKSDADRLKKHDGFDGPTRWVMEPHLAKASKPSAAKKTKPKAAKKPKTKKSPKPKASKKPKAKKAAKAKVKAVRVKPAKSAKKSAPKTARKPKAKGKAKGKGKGKNGKAKRKVAKR